MKHFLEMNQILTAEEILDATPPVSIRVEVNGKADAVSKKPQFLQYFSNKSHKDTHHTCHHPGGKCEEEVI